MDLLENQANLTLKELEKKHKKDKFWLIFKNMLFLFLVIFLSSLFFLSNIVANSETKFATTIKKNPLIQQISHLISSETRELKGEKNGRTNILIMGMGGQGHDGALLTDTIIVLSYNYENSETSMVSIPRDMVVKTNSSTYKKINHLYTIGEYSKQENGLEYSREIISKNIGIPLHYAIVIDFFGFEEIVDALGGVDVIVENSFIDNQYPTKNHKVQTIKFEKGKTHLDGEEALQFSRSRHGIVTEGNGYEASDYARSNRQFKVISAIKDKILSFSTITNPQKVIKLFKILQDYIDTNIETWEALRFIEVLRSINRENIYNKVLNDAPDNLLRSATSTYDGAFILIPKNNDYNALSSFFINIFEIDKLEKEQAVIHILNGTKANGLASQYANKLIHLNLNVQRINNAPRQDVKTTIIYDLSKNQKPETLKKIQNDILGARSNILPEELKDYALESDLDFLIVLGEDQIKN